MLRITHVSMWRLEMFYRSGFPSYSSESLIVDSSEFRFFQSATTISHFACLSGGSQKQFSAVTFHPHFCIICCIIELVLVRNMHEIFGTECFSVFDLPTSLFNNKMLTCVYLNFDFSYKYYEPEVAGQAGYFTLYMLFKAPFTNKGTVKLIFQLIQFMPIKTRV